MHCRKSSFNIKDNLTKYIKQFSNYYFKFIWTKTTNLCINVKTCRIICLFFIYVEISLLFYKSNLILIIKYSQQQNPIR